MKYFKIGIPDSWIKAMLEELEYQNIPEDSCPAEIVDRYLMDKLGDIETNDILSTIVLGETDCPDCKEENKLKLLHSLLRNTKWSTIKNIERDREIIDKIFKDFFPEIFEE